MADTSSDAERSEAATPKRREDARAEGNIPRSQELTIAVSLLTSALVLYVAGPIAGRALTGIFAAGLTSVAMPSFAGPGAAALLRELGWRAGVAILPLVLSLAIPMLAIGALQARGTWSITPITPNLERISPRANMKRIFGAQQVIELLKSLAKFGIVAAVVYPALEKLLPLAVTLSDDSPLGFLMIIRSFAIRLLATAGVAYLALAIGDYLWQYWRHERSLRMTREEFKQELRQQDGDPMLKHRRRSLARARARRQMMRDVRKAHVVITNPTHIAVALRYDPKVAPAPIVLAIGQNLLAQRIKEIARDAGVPMIENRPLARALLKTARVGSLIPTELYIAVAEVLAFVFRTRKSRGSWTGSAVV